MVKNPPSSAGDMGSIPGQRAKIPHAAGQLSPHTVARETRTPQQEKPSHNKKKANMHCSEDPVQPKRSKKKKNHERPKRRNRQLYRYNWGIQHSQQLIEQKVIQGIKELNTIN